MGTIAVAGLDLDESDLTIEHIRASGPGGQNVNKVASAIQLRFDPHRLHEAVRGRLATLAGSRMTKDGILVIKAQRFRTQEANERDAYARLAELLGQAQIRPTPRRPTRPSRSAKRERTDSKVKRGRVKAMRGRVTGDE
jgi:ribosome-associated protein